MKFINNDHIDKTGLSPRQDNLTWGVIITREGKWVRGCANSLTVGCVEIIPQLQNILYIHRSTHAMIGTVGRGDNLNWVSKFRKDA